MRELGGKAACFFGVKMVAYTEMRDYASLLLRSSEIENKKR